ncbi:hypothetical protein DFH29DRAFT_1000006 [Suillus ampliporus]|nr:hypothetical protein DFH29DRAFT_1000006 [Suillus ampliporus]
MQVPNHGRKPGAALKSVQGGTGSPAPRNTVHPGSPKDELNNDEQLEVPGSDKGEQDPLLTPLMVQVIKNPPSNKAAQATSTATSTRPTPNEPPSCPPSHAPLHPPSHAPLHAPLHPPSHAPSHATSHPPLCPPSCPPSHPPLDDKDMHNGKEQDDDTCPESESQRPYMWKFKVTGSGKSNAGDKTHSKDCGYSSNVDQECCNDRATGRQRQQGKYNPPSGKSKCNSNKYKTEDDNGQ